MRYLPVLLLAIFAACDDDESPPCTNQPEPFRFRVVDQSGGNLLVSRPNNTRMFYIENATDVSLELEFEGNDEETYGVSNVLPILSVFNDVDTYYLERGNNVDTLVVRVSELQPGNSCGGYSYDAVSFNSAQATYDDTTEPPVYILPSR